MARPRADDYEAKRQLIRERAAELFADHGFARTSIADVARACQCTKSLIYHYFDSKQAILHDLLAAHMDGLSRAVPICCCTPTFQLWLRVVLMSYGTVMYSAYRFWENG